MGEEKRKETKAETVVFWLKTIVKAVVAWVIVLSFLGFLVFGKHFLELFRGDFPWNILKILGAGALAVFIIIIVWILGSSLLRPRQGDVSKR